MRRVRSILALLLLGSVAAYATVADRHRLTYSLVGTWIYEDRQTRPRSVKDCETDYAVTYAADGTFSGYEQGGIWRAEGGDLIETVTEKWEIGAEPEVQRISHAQPSRSRLEWISPDVVNVLGKDGADALGLVRCQPYEGD